MDSLEMLRGDIEQMRLDPLTRSRLMGAADDARWLREEEMRRAEAAARFEANLMQQQAVERAEIAAWGYSTRELAEVQREREAARAARIADLTEELERLRRQDPQYREQVARSQQQAARVGDMTRTLMRARQAGENPLMRRLVAEFDARREAARRAAAGAEIERLEEICRSGY